MIEFIVHIRDRKGVSTSKDSSLIVRIEETEKVKEFLLMYKGEKISYHSWEKFTRLNNINISIA